MSAKDQIICLPNSHLRQASTRVVANTPISKVIKQMKDATLDWEANRPHEVGVALAAIQIDRPQRIIIIRNNFEDKSDKTFMVLVNPEIVKLEGSIEEEFEGCLSVVDVYGKVPRYSKVRVRARDEQGREIRVKAEGFLARVLQHEIDHIRGTMFVDHIADNKQAFYRLTKDGKLESMPYEQVQKAGLLRE
jgi:peptide deformylase